MVTVPGYLTVNLIVMVWNKNRELDELLFTGALLFVVILVGIAVQFSPFVPVLALVWACVRKFEASYARSNEKLNCKFNGYSWTLACCLGIFYSAGKILAYDAGSYTLEGVLGAVVAGVFIFGFAGNEGARVERESSYQTSYIVVYALAVISGEPWMHISYLLISKTSVFFLSSQTQEILPGNSKSGVISHILSHKDSRRIFLFLM
jgi:hypothetical protein